MLLVRGKVANHQVILSIGLQRFDPVPLPVQSVSPAQNLEIRQFRALVDTGAQLTCITASAAAQCGLRSYGKTLISGVGGPKPHRQFLFRIGFWCEVDDGRTSEVGDTSMSYFGIKAPQEAVEIPDNSEFDIIIGMNTLGLFDFSFSRSGEFILKIGNDQLY